MSYPAKILFRSFIKSFYKENAGAFVLLFTIMFYIVNEVDGAGLFEYHYSLIIGMLKSNVFLLLVFFAWLLYAGKYVAFVSTVLRNPQYAFLNIFNRLSKSKQFRLFFIVEVWLLIPVLLYGLFIIIIGFYESFYFPTLLVLGYLILLSIVPAVWHVYQLNNPHKDMTLRLRPNGRSRLSPSYQVILIRFVANKQKMIWVGVKAFTCSLLYLIARNNTYADYDIGPVFLFFKFGILDNGIMIHRIRGFEETYLTFYRGIPVPLMKRFLQYSLVYFIFLIPEFITAGMLVPTHLRYADAFRFSLCGYSLLLLMNSITFLQDFSMKEYLKILLLIFGIQYIFLMTVGLTFLYLFLFILAIVFFLPWYYKFERSV
jgi:hypothetical protein